MRASTIGIAVALALVAAAAVYWVGRTDSMPVDRDGAVTEGASAMEADADGTRARTGEGDADAMRASGPVLFGRPPEERVGRGRVLGVVMDFATKKPVEGASILVSGTGHGGETVSLRRATGASGTFHFDEVPAGENHRLHVTAPRFPARSLVLGVEPGSVHDVGTVWLGAPGVLTGRVVADDGRPLGGIDVRLHAAMAAEDFNFAAIIDALARVDVETEPMARVRTDGRGEFEIQDVPPGPVVLAVNAPGFAPTTESVFMSADGPGGGPVEIRLPRGRTVKGIVVDAEDRPIAGAALAQMANDASSFLFAQRASTTDAQGKFSIDTLPAAGKATLIVAARGFATAFMELDPSAGDVRVVLQRSAPVRVRVTAGGGEAISGAHVAMATGKDATLRGTPGGLSAGSTDASGRVTLNVPPGHIQLLMVNHPDYASGMYIGGMGAMLSSLRIGDAEVPPSGRTLDVTLGEGILLSGRVLDGANSPLAGVIVRSQSMMGGAPAVATSDEEGRYSLRVSPMPAMMFGAGGAAFLRASAPGWVQKPDTATVSFEKNAREVEHDVVMVRPAVVVGRVQDPAGAPIAGARVTVSEPSGGMSFSMNGAEDAEHTSVTAADGQFFVDGVAPGKGITVSARRRGFAEGKSESLEAGAGARIDAGTIVLRPSARLRVRVVDPDGLVLSGAAVEVDATGASFGNEYETLTDAAGFATATDLTPGSARVTASLQGFASARESVTIEDAGDQEVTVRLRREAPVRGRVVGTDGEPLAGATVSTGSGMDVMFEAAPRPGDAEREWIPHVTATTDAAGKFELRGLPDVALTLTARAAGHERNRTDVAGNRADLEIRLQKEDPERAVRRKKLQSRLEELMPRLTAATDDAEREALQQEMQDLVREMGELGAFDEGFGAVAVSVEDGDVETDDAPDIEIEDAFEEEAPSSPRPR